MICIFGRRLGKILKLIWQIQIFLAFDPGVVKRSYVSALKLFLVEDMTEEAWLLLISVSFGLTIILEISITKRFILSKPPGRRMVTSDIHLCQVGLV